MSGPTADVKLVSNAMANAARRKIMNLLVEADRSQQEIEKAAGGSMLDYHLTILEQAGLIRRAGDIVALSDFGRSFMGEKMGAAVKPASSLAGTKPLQVVEVAQLLPCIADPSKFRVIARLTPPLGGALKLLEPLFPRGRYSERIGALIIQRGQMLITLYSSGSVTMTMIASDAGAREVLDEIKGKINEAIEKGVTPAPREKVRVDPMEINRYLPGTNCGECGEQGCYSFAVRLMAGEVSIDACPVLKGPDYATNLEHLKVLIEYI